MSDLGRKDFSDKAKESLKPDSEKSYMEQGKEYVTDKADKLSGKMQPNEDKGVAQGLHDSVQEGKDDATAQRGSRTEDMKEEANDYYNAAKEKLNDAAKYVSNQLHGGESKD